MADDIASLVDRIVRNFKNMFEEYKNRLFSDPISFKTSNNDKSANTHSLLQYILIKAGESAGFMAIPEVKLKFKNIFKPNEKFRNILDDISCESIRDIILKKKSRSFKKVDVAFALDEGSLNFIGFGEIYTIDGAFKCLETGRILKALDICCKNNKIQIKNNDIYISDYDLLLHLVENSDLKFAVIITVLPKSAKIAWKSHLQKLKEIEGIDKLFKNKNSSGNYYKAFKAHWKGLREELANNKKLDCRLLIITEKDKNHDDFIVEPIP